MKATLTTDYQLPATGDYVILPFATARIEPGAYHLTIQGRVKQSTINTQQLMIKPTFGMPGAPVLSSAEVMSILFGPGQGVSFNGSAALQTSLELIEQGTVGNGISVDKPSWFFWRGYIVVSQAGYLSLAAGASDTDPADYNTFLAGLTIELDPEP